ncbi:MAG TPA: hypothetical protein VF807_12170 [Ktedonobacterales bacterium]
MLAALASPQTRAHHLLARTGLTGTQALWALWVLSRAIMLIATVTGARWCDPWFYHYAGELQAGHLPYRDLSVEYPPLAMALILAPAVLLLPWAAISPRPDAAFNPPLLHLPAPDPARYAAYGLAFALIMLVVDALALVMVIRGARAMLGARPAFAAGALYLAVTFIMGGVLQKFDLVVGVLLLYAVVALWRGRPIAPWLALGASVLIKGFPLFIAPAFLCFILLRTRGDTLMERWIAARRRLGAGSAVFAGLIVAPALLIAVWASPQAVWHTVIYHAGRGLEIESVPAGIAIVLSGLLRMRVVTAFHAQDLSRVVITPLDGVANALAALLGLWLAVAWLWALANSLRARGQVAEASSDLAGWLLFSVAAPMLSFMVAFGALPLHYLLVVAPLGVLLGVSIGHEYSRWRVSLVSIVVTGALVIGVWGSLRALAPWAVSILLLRNGAWVALSVTCMMGMNHAFRRLVERMPEL